LRVEIAGTSTAIPEPSLFALMGIGLADLIGYGRKGWRGSVHLPPQTKSDKRSGKL